MNKVWMKGELRVSVLRVGRSAVQLSANFIPEGADGSIPVGGAPEFNLEAGHDLTVRGLMMEVNLGDEDVGPVPLAASSGRGDGVATMTVVKPDGSEE